MAPALLRLPAMTPSSAAPIGFVMSSFNPGGTERQMIELIRRLDRSRWDVHVASLRSKGEWLPRVREAAPTAEFLLDSFKRPQLFDRMKSFARWCREKNFQVVHAVDLPANIFGLPAAAFAGVPVRIGTRREINPGRSLSMLTAQRTSYSCAHKVVANCLAAARRLRLEGVGDRKIAVIRNGLDLPLYSAARPPRLPRRIVVVGNLRPEKGHDVLIDAAVDILRRFPDAEFRLVGGGTEHARLMALAEARGVSHAMQFLGHCEDVPAQLASADVFVLPSRSEAFPNAVLEAMAAGLPVVASSVGGVLESVDDGRTGLLVPPGNPAQLTEAICRLMADPEMAARLGKAGRANAERFSFDRMITAFDRLYTNELARRGTLPAARAQLVAS